MLFNAHTDTLDRIEGYFIPNGFSTKPKIRVTGRGETLFSDYCSGMIENVKRTGRHRNGIVAFALDASQVFGIADINDLSIFDDETGFLIYRRNSTDNFIQKRVFCVETTLGAMPTIGTTLMPYFAYGLATLHFYDHETRNQLFDLTNYPSMFFEGRVYLKPYQRFMNENLYSIISLDDPFIALASTLISISQLAKTTFKKLDERTIAMMQPLIEHMHDIDLRDHKKIRAGLSLLPKCAMSCIKSPLVSMLTSEGPGVSSSSRDIPAALEALSVFDLIIAGPHAEYELAECEIALGLQEGTLQNNSYSPEVLNLAEVLRGIPAIQIALENDLITHQCLRDANQEKRRQSHG